MLEGGLKSFFLMGINGVDCILIVNEIVVKFNVIWGKMIYFFIFISLLLKFLKLSIWYIFKFFFLVCVFEELGIMFWEFVWGKGG